MKMDRTKIFGSRFFYFQIVCETLRESQMSSKPFLNTLGHSWNNNLKINFLEIFDFSWDFQCWRPNPWLTHGDARALVALSKVHFLGMFVLFFRKYIHRRVCKKILNKKYGRVFVLKASLKTVSNSLRIWYAFAEKLQNSSLSHRGARESDDNEDSIFWVSIK